MGQYVPSSHLIANIHKEKQQQMNKYSVGKWQMIWFTCLNKYIYIIQILITYIYEITYLTFIFLITSRKWPLEIKSHFVVFHRHMKKTIKLQLMLWLQKREAIFFPENKYFLVYVKWNSIHL